IRDKLVTGVQTCALPIYTGTHLELRQHLPRPGIHRLEPAVERTVESHVAGGHQRAAPVWIRLPVLPDLAPGCRIPRHERTEVPARAGKVWTGDAHEGRTLQAARACGRVVHAQ